MELSFSADIKDVDIYGLEEHLKLPKTIDLDIEKSPATVEFTLTPTIKSWGIDSIMFLARKVTYSLQWTVHEADELSLEERAALIAAGAIEMRNNTFEGQIDIKATMLDEKDWELKDDIDFASDGGFQITDVEIDFAKKTITLT